MTEVATDPRRHPGEVSHYRNQAFTDQRPHEVSVRILNLPWNGRHDQFHCYLCGYAFREGDTYRWVFGQGKIANFLICATCDGPDVFKRFRAACDNIPWYIKNQLRRARDR